MAFKAAIDSSEKGEKTFLQRDKDTGKPVYLYLQIVPEAFIRALRRDQSRGVRADKIGKLPAGELLERSIESHRAYAAKAIVGPGGSENFEIEMATQATADEFAKAIGGGIEIRAGETVCLDGKWSEEVKDLALRVLPGFVERVTDLADEKRGFAAEAEDEADKSFR